MNFAIPGGLAQEHLDCAMGQHTSVIQIQVGPIKGKALVLSIAQLVQEPLRKGSDRSNAGLTIR
jgi:hypothetical protein